MTSHAALDQPFLTHIAHTSQGPSLTHIAHTGEGPSITHSAHTGERPSSSSKHNVDQKLQKMDLGMFIKEAFYTKQDEITMS